ncbi:MAG TPA: hypothetical protein EYP09_05105 [Anaerolineae bacterium]|nr:hypothetical protein [Anaerolineae bacterium]
MNALLIASLALPPHGSAYAGGFEEIKAVAREVIRLAVQVTALLLAIAIASGFVGGEISAAAGAPTILSEIWFRIMGAVICLLVAVLAVPISNMIVDAIF